MKHINKCKLAFLIVLTVGLVACGSDSKKPEADTDGDTIPDARDNCIHIINTDQLNSDGDSAGDACDDLPQDASDTKDFDGDKIGDTADLDDDNDTYNDDIDVYPFDGTEWADADGDNIGDNKDLDPTSTNPNSIQLDQLIANGRVTKFIGGFSGSSTDYLGKTVKLIGDVNGDELNDLFITIHRAGLDGFITGVAYLLFGQEGGWPATVDLADLSNIPHVIFRGDNPSTFHAEMGADVTPMGDIDKDGIDDFMISASLLHNETIDNEYSGIAFLVFGRSTWQQDAGEDKIITAAELAGYSVSFRGKLERGLLGRKLINVGDLNNDGLPDVAITENIYFDYRDPNVGRIHLMFNMARYTKANISESHDIEDIVNTESTLNRVTLEGETRFFGQAIQGMGDFNDDGYDDLIITDPGAVHWPDDLFRADGSAYIVFGKPNPSWSNSWDLDSMVEGEGFIFKNIGGEFSSGLAPDLKVADLNADNIPDVVASSISINSSGNNSQISRIYVLWGGGGTWPVSIAVNNIPAELGLTMRSEEVLDSLGTQVEVVPDLNNNGLPELLISTGEGDLVGDPNLANRIYKMDASLISEGFEIGPKLVGQGSAERITMTEIEEGDPFFMHVIGDVNGDGLSEITLSASLKDSNNFIDNGEFYLLYGYDRLYPQEFKVRDSDEE